MAWDDRSDQTGTLRRAVDTMCSSFCAGALDLDQGRKVAALPNCEQQKSNPVLPGIIRQLIAMA